MLASALILPPMDATSYEDIKSSLRQLYLDDPRPWLVGFSGGNNSTMLASLNANGLRDPHRVLAGPAPSQRRLCTGQIRALRGKVLTPQVA